MTAPATPAIDGTVVSIGLGNGATSITLGTPGYGSLNTTTANVLIVGAFNQGGPPLATIGSIVSPGLTFTKVASATNPESGEGLNLEVWSAPLHAPLVNALITFNMLGNAVDSGICFAFGLIGVDPLNPFDLGGGTLPASAITTGAAAATIPAYKTTRNADLLLYLFGQERVSSTIYPPPDGFTELTLIGDYSGARQITLHLATYAPGRVLTGASVTGPATSDGVMMLLAFQAPLVTLTVPNEVGATSAAAVTALAAAGLNLAAAGVALEFSFTVPEGFVIAQTPAGGAIAEVGDPFTLIVSEGPLPFWSLSPDWQTPVREKIGFLTDVMTAWSGAEQRRSLRIAPRRVFQFSTLAQGAEKRYIENALFAWGAIQWEVPIFPDGQRLPAALAPGATVVACDTVQRDFVAPGLALVLIDALTAEILQISAISPTALTLSAPVLNAWGAGSRLYPLRQARLLSTSKVQHESQQVATLTLEFTVIEPCDFPAATGLPVYRTQPVLEDSPDASIAAAGGYPREAYITDSTTGAIDVYDTAGIPFPTNTHQWFLNGRSARAAFRSLLYLLKGRLGMIWVPSYDADLQLIAPVASGDITLTVEACGLSQFAAVQNRRDIRIELKSGAIFYRRIVSAALGTSAEIVTLDSALGVAVALGTARRISFMALSRLDADEIELQHLAMCDGLATAQTPFRALNYEPV